MIVSIGFTPGAVGSAEASPIQTPGTSCSSPGGPRDRRLRIGAEPARAHLVGRVREPAVRRRLEPRDVGVEVVARAPAEVVPVEGEDLPRAARAMEAASSTCARAATARSIGSSSAQRTTASPSRSSTTSPAPVSCETACQVAAWRSWSIRSLCGATARERQATRPRTAGSARPTRRGSPSPGRRRRSRTTPSPGTGRPRDSPPRRTGP